MGEYLREEFPELDIHAGISDPKIAKKIAQEYMWPEELYWESSLFDPERWAESDRVAGALEAEMVSTHNLIPPTPERIARSQTSFLEKPDYP